jgi:hypothetical protein
MPRVTLVEGINLALARALADDPDVIVLGEDVGVSCIRRSTRSPTTWRACATARAAGSPARW